MNVFDISFVPSADPVDGASRGEIRIGSFSERFAADLTFWGQARYERQWLEAAGRIVSHESAVFVTSVPDPASANFVRWWAMYREGEAVVLQEQICFLEELAGPFDPDRPERFLRERESVSEDGDEVSEWRTTVGAVRDFLARRS
jgi:CdiI N-terminal domain